MLGRNGGDHKFVCSCLSHDGQVRARWAGWSAPPGPKQFLAFFTWASDNGRTQNRRVGARAGHTDGSPGYPVADLGGVDGTRPPARSLQTPGGGQTSSQPCPNLPGMSGDERSAASEHCYCERQAGNAPDFDLRVEIEIWQQAFELGKRQGRLSAERDSGRPSDVSPGSPPSRATTDGEAGGVAGMTRDELLALPPSVDLLLAARALGIGRSLAYDLAKRDAFPVRLLRLGTRYRVPTAELRSVLGVEDISAPRDPVRNVAAKAR